MEKERKKERRGRVRGIGEERKRGKEILRAHPEPEKDDPSKRDHEVEGDAGAREASFQGRETKADG